MVVFSVAALFFWALGLKLLALVSLFYLISIPVRVVDTWSDMLGPESIGIMGIFLAIIGGPTIAAFYMFTSTWFTRLICPFADIEEYQYTISESIGMAAAAMLSPMLIAPSGATLLMFAFYFCLIRYSVFLFMMFLTMPGTFMIDLFQTVVEFPWTMLQTIFVINLVGLSLLASFGIANWAIGSLGALLSL